MPLRFTLASRNHFHDRLRFVATMVVFVYKSNYVHLGNNGLGAMAEIRGQPVQVTGLTDGIRSFTTTPYVFVDMSRARTYVGIPKTYANYFLVKIKPGADAKQVASAIK